MKKKWKDLPGVEHGRKMNWGAMPGMSVVKPKLLPLATSIHGTIDTFELHAIVSTWFEEDIIEATVTNCFRQGCDTVTILDNDSQDRTVDLAVSLGAKIGEVYRTDLYDDDLRIRKQNQIAKNIVESSSASCVWILCLDADEFLHGTQQRTVRETLQSIPAIVRTVGCFGYDMWPAGKGSYVTGTHPALTMQNCIQRKTTTCGLLHWKHPALKYTPKTYDISQNRGNHDIAAKKNHVVYESSDHCLYMIHAPYRTYEYSMARLQRLCGGAKDQRRSSLDDDVTGNAGAIRRLQNIERVYAGDFRNVSLPHHFPHKRELIGVVPYPLKNYCPDLNEAHFVLK